MWPEVGWSASNGTPTSAALVGQPRPVARQSARVGSGSRPAAARSGPGPGRRAARPSGSCSRTRRRRSRPRGRAHGPACWPSSRAPAAAGSARRRASSGATTIPPSAVVMFLLVKKLNAAASLTVPVAAGQAGDVRSVLEQQQPVLVGQPPPGRQVHDVPAVVHHHDRPGARGDPRAARRRATGADGPRPRCRRTPASRRRARRRRRWPRSSSTAPGPRRRLRRRTPRG